MDSPPSQHARWFSEEVQPHEPSLRAYLHARFPTVRDVDDVVQSSYLRIWRRRMQEPIGSVRAFLFTIARNMALDLVRRERRSPLEDVGESAVLDVVDDNASVRDQVGRAERIQLLIDAIDALPPRCREVIILRKFKFLSQREVATRLGITEDGVEIQVTRGLARCRAYLHRQGIRSLYDDEG